MLVVHLTRRDDFLEYPKRVIVIDLVNFGNVEWIKLANSQKGIKGFMLRSLG